MQVRQSRTRGRQVGGCHGQKQAKARDRAGSPRRNSPDFGDQGFKGCEVEPRLVGTSELQREKKVGARNQLNRLEDDTDRNRADTKTKDPKSNRGSED